jgi:uncharacterized protein YeaO (DUF488 family)
MDAEESIPSPLPSVRPSLLAGRPRGARQQLADAFTDAWETGVLAGERLRTGCVYEGQPRDSYCIAVLRYDPRLGGRRQVPFHEWWPELAPSAPLLTAYRTMDAYGQRQLVWEKFARAYLAELDALPARPLLDFIATLNDMPSRYRSVTLLGCEHATAADEGRVKCHRRLLRAWLLGEEVPDLRLA